LYDTLIPDPDEREWFLTEVCSPEWNAAQDAGRDWETAVAELCARFPSWASHIEAYSTRWAEMVAGPLEQTVAVLAELRARGVPPYAPTNFSAQKWGVALERWDFLRGFAVQSFLGVKASSNRIRRSTGSWWSASTWSRRGRSSPMT